MKVTIKDIAREADVSITTVSLIINQKGQRFSTDTHAKVNEAIVKLNYQPHYFAKNLNKTKSKTIGFIVSEITNPFFAELAKVIEDILVEQGYLVLLCNSSSDLAREERYVDEMLYRFVDGVFLAGTVSDNKHLLSKLASRRVPYLLLDRPSDYSDTNGVFIDDFAGGMTATEHLLQKGHTAIGCITTKPQFSNIYQRSQGYLAAMKAIKQAPLLEEAGFVNEQSGYLAAQALINKGVSAIFACNDLMAFGVYKAAEEAGLSVPADLSVIGFDDINLAHFMSPPLTTITQPTQRIGAIAARHMLALIETETVEIATTILPISLKERESVKTKEKR
ncbi:LacI family DNA-binding transcriptional regulator [Brochothrix campestris]|uniref:LacI family DNA-binding transcriptional regulator n=1 Tax=Brochothrix campestris TaxID=2757 RepID=UPI0038D0F7F0